MRRLAVVLALIAASCGGDDTATTTSTAPTTTSVPSTTTTTAVVTTTTDAPTTTSTTTTTIPVPSGFLPFTHSLFTLSYPDSWSENPDFPGSGVGFIEDHTALALPATDFSVSLEEQEAGFDLDAHIQRIKDDLAFFVPDFRVLSSGEEPVDGAPSVWFEYSEEINGFPAVIREQVALRETLLVTFTLISPVEFFEFDAAQTALVVESFRFS